MPLPPLCPSPCHIVTVSFRAPAASNHRPAPCRPFRKERRMLRTLLLASLLAILIPCRAGGAQPAAPPPERRMTLDLHGVPLRAALTQLFEGSGLNFAVDPGVPDVAITLSLRDVSVDGGLRQIVDSLAAQTP